MPEPAAAFAAPADDAGFVVGTAAFEAAVPAGAAAPAAGPNALPPDAAVPATGAPSDFRKFASPNEAADDALRNSVITEDDARAIQGAAWRAVERAKKR